jgi:cytochrome P450
MLSLDGAEHRRQRDPFARALRAPEIRSRLARVAIREAEQLVAELAASGAPAELRRGIAGPLAVTVMAEMLGLEADATRLLTWYDAIVAGVSALSVPAGHDDDAANAEAPRVPEPAAAAFGELSASVRAALAHGTRHSVLTAVADDLPIGNIVSNAAVLLFGGIETTEGMICNAIWYLLRNPDALEAVTADRSLMAAAVEESLRLEPAAAVVDRYAAADVELEAVAIHRGDLVTVSLAGANRDPARFGDPDNFDLYRNNARQHLAFAVGSHFCVGAQLARLEASAALGTLIDQLPGLRLDASRPTAPYGLVFRKPAALHVEWG